jgi:hypothetical protein
MAPGCAHVDEISRDPLPSGHTSRRWEWRSSIRTVRRPYIPIRSTQLPDPLDVVRLDVGFWHRTTTGCGGAY